MPRERLSLRIIREVLRLRFQSGLANERPPRAARSVSERSMSTSAAPGMPALAGRYPKG